MWASPAMGLMQSATVCREERCGLTAAQPPNVLSHGWAAYQPPLQAGAAGKAGNPPDPFMRSKRVRLLRLNANCAAAMRSIDLR
jgi:hypothetical protein